jgi:hypothetical protein
MLSKISAKLDGAIVTTVPNPVAFKLRYGFGLVDGIGQYQVGVGGDNFFNVRHVIAADVGFLCRFRGIIAVIGDTDDLISQPQGEEDFRIGRGQGNVLWGSVVSRVTVLPNWSITVTYSGEVKVSVAFPQETSIPENIITVRQIGMSFFNAVFIIILSGSFF